MVSLRIIVSSIGALSWTLLMAQVPMAAAQDGLFHRCSVDCAPRGVRRSASVSAGLATALPLCTGVRRARVRLVYNLIVNLSTMAAVIPYAFCALAGGLIGAGAKTGGPEYRIGGVEIVAFLFGIRCTVQRATLMLYTPDAADLRSPYTSGNSAGALDDRCFPTV